MKYALHGLLALMLLHDSRREARVVGGELIPLAEQDRSRHDQAKVEAGRSALNRALALRSPAGPHMLQAAIASYRSSIPPGAELLRRLGRDDEAREAFERALRLAATDLEHRFLVRRLSELDRA